MRHRLDEADGSEMQVDDWATHRTLAVLVSGHGIAERGPRRARLFDDDFLLLVNAHPEPVEIVLPHGEPQWRLVVDTAEEPRAVDAQDSIWAAQSYPLQGRSLALLRRTRPPP
jgi:glycogen operon protein